MGQHSRVRRDRTTIKMLLLLILREKPDIQKHLMKRVGLNSHTLKEILGEISWLVTSAKTTYGSSVEYRLTPRGIEASKRVRETLAALGVSPESL